MKYRKKKKDYRHLTRFFIENIDRRASLADICEYAKDLWLDERIAEHEARLRDARGAAGRANYAVESRDAREDIPRDTLPRDP